MNFKYYFVGPAHGLNTGQKVCFLASIDSLCTDKEVFSLGGHGLAFFEKLTIPMVSYVKFLISIVFSKNAVVYVTPSRSLKGFLREAPFLFTSLVFSKYKIAHWHGADLKSFMKNSSPIVRSVFVWVYRRFDEHIVLTENMKEQVEVFLPCKISVVGNFHNIKPAIRKKQSSDKLEIVFLSNLIPTKGVFYAIDLHDRLSDICNLTVVGALPDNADQAKEVLSKIECSSVKYRGYLEGQEKEETLSSADVFLFPSTYPTEAFPLVILEAMASGLALIAFDHNYMKDFFNSKGGFLLSPNDIKGGCDAVELLYKNRDLLEECKKANVEHSKLYTLASYKESLNIILKGCG